MSLVARLLVVLLLAIAASQATPVFAETIKSSFQGGTGGGTDNGIQGGVPQTQGQPTSVINPLSAGTNLETLLQEILKLLIRIGSIVIVLMLVYIGFLFTTTSINPENKNKAREYLLWTVVGALILLGAQAISIGIQETVNALSAGQ